MWISQDQTWSADASVLTGFWPLPHCLPRLPATKEIWVSPPSVSLAWIALGIIFCACFSCAGPGSLWTPWQAGWQVAGCCVAICRCFSPQLSTHQQKILITFCLSACPTVSGSVKISLPLCSTGSPVPNLLTVLFSFCLCYPFPLQWAGGADAGMSLMYSFLFFIQRFWMCVSLIILLSNV